MPHGYSTRAVRVGGAPTISVLLTSTGPRARLEACLEQLLPVCVDLRAQVTVARAYTDEELAEMQHAFPTVCFAAAAAGSSVAELRTLGMESTEGDIVVLSDDTELTAAELADRFSPTRRYDLTQNKGSHDRA